MELSSEAMNNTKTEMVETEEQFNDVLKALQYINDPLNDLASSPSAVVYYRTPCCDMRCCFPTCGGSDKCCDSTYKYNTLVKVGGGNGTYAGGAALDKAAAVGEVVGKEGDGHVVPDLLGYAEVGAQVGVIAVGRKGVHVAGAQDQA